MLTNNVDIVLVDVNPAMVWAWQHAFERNAEVRIVHDSMLNQRVDAWVTPTNSRGSMDGGLDWMVKKALGSGIERKVKKEISRLYGGRLPVGYATCVETGHAFPRYLISAPTMHASAENVSGTCNAALACAAAFQAIATVNASAENPICSVAVPGLGACTGRVPVKTCAYLMWVAYNLARSETFTSFEEMREALERELWTRMERPGAA
jgi:O-acetyl-ADP-ribose deacetylase (regulator of RNase III)